MRELKNFTPTNKEKANVEKEKGQANLNENDVKQMIDERSSKSEEELMSELKEEVQKSKNEGRFNSSEVENFKKTVLPFLNEEQKSKLDEIIKMIT